MDGRKSGNRQKAAELRGRHFQRAVNAIAPSGARQPEEARSAKFRATFACADPFVSFASRLSSARASAATFVASDVVPAVVGRSIFASPGIPAERVKALREAFTAMTKDPVFLAEIEQTKADLEAEGKVFESNPGQDVIFRMVKDLKRPGRKAHASIRAET